MVNQKRPPNYTKSFSKILPMTMSISWQGLSSTDLQFKRYIKMRSISIANTHHDVKTFKVDGTVNKKKLNISRVEHDFSMK